MKFDIFHESRVGARPYNQDRCGHWHTGEALMLVLADGMGGHANGEVAAELALEAVGAAFQSAAKPRVANPDLFIAGAIGRAHAHIIAEATRRGLPEAPRTTIVACVVQEGVAHWAHVGDSRLYLIRRGRVIARTRDHTRVQQLIDAGRIREEAAASHPERNRILQCLGADFAPRLDPTQSERLKKNDVLMLCSDGLWGPLTQRQLLHAYVTSDLARATRDLMSMAESRAGAQCDNVTVLAVNYGEDEVLDPSSPRTVPMDALPPEQHGGEVRTATDPDYMRMSDADIDKAIDEIKAALKRSKPDA